MNAYVQAFKDLDAETLNSMLTGDAREKFKSDFEEMPEEIRPQIRQMLSQMEVVNQRICR